MLKNNDIRAAAATKSVKLWQIAEELGISDSSFSRKLRKELSTEEMNHIFEIIDKLSQEVR